MTTILAIIFAVAILVVFYLLVEAVNNIQRWFTSSIEGHANVTLSEMFLFISAEALTKIMVLTVFIAGILTYFIIGSIIFAIIVAIGSSLLPKFIYKIMKNRRQNTLLNQLPDSLLSIANSMKAGANFNSALEMLVKEEAPPISQEFGLVIRELRLGVEYADALKNLEKRVPVDEMSLFVSGLLIARETGGNLSEMLYTLSDTIRKKIEMEGKIKALTAQGKMQGIVMTSLPVLIGLALNEIEPEAMSYLTTEWYGWVVIAVSFVLICIGYFFIRKIVSINV